MTTVVFFDLNSPLEFLPVSSRSLRRTVNESATDNFCALPDPHSFTDCVDVDSLSSRFDLLCGSVLDKVAPFKFINPSHKQHCPRITEDMMNFKRLCHRT